MAPLRIGTRGSALARVQAGLVARLLEQRAPAIEPRIVVIGVSGDERDGRRAEGGDASPAAPAAADKSRWVDRIEDALRDGRIDVAVHSAKDVPGQLAPGLVLLGAPPRADPRDALCGGATVSTLPPGACVGTSSVRRAAQLRAARADLEILTLHGNVDTRLRRLGEGACEAIVLAYAGLVRLGRCDDAKAVPLDPHEFVPAPGQGVLALEGRADDEHAIAAVRAISDAATERALAAERAVVRALEATCHTPVGAHARDDGAELELTAFVGLPDGSAWTRDRMLGPADDPETLGRRVGERLLATGARALLEQAEEMALERT